MERQGFEEEMPEPPDGITDVLPHPLNVRRRLTGIAPIALLAAILLAALLGFGGRETTLRATANGTTMEWHGPERIRNGEVLELRLGVTSERAIEGLVVEVPHSLWEDITISSLIPAAAEETSSDGVFRFAYGPLAPGTEFRLKVDGQLNPDIAGGNAGVVRVLDGDVELVSLSVTIEVLP
jgi:hypothetical protein